MCFGNWRFIKCSRSPQLVAAKWKLNNQEVNHMSRKENKHLQGNMRQNNQNRNNEQDFWIFPCEMAGKGAMRCALHYK